MEERLWLWEGTAGPQVLNSPLPLGDLPQVAFATFALASGAPASFNTLAKSGLSLFPSRTLRGHDRVQKTR